jgi:hypothetical protein
MTEAEWLNCTDPQPMLEFLKGKASDRKLRLFAVACCRRIWHMLSDERSRRAVEIAELFADGLVRESDRCAAEFGAFHAYRGAGGNPIGLGGYAAPSAAHSCISKDASFAHAAASDTTEAVATEDGYASGDWSLEDYLQSERKEKAALCVLLRDIFANPHRPVSINAAWLTPPVTSAKHAIYSDRVFDLMPALADALEQAGCHDPDILAHCRCGGEHVRGCWLLDLLLGKA